MATCEVCGSDVKASSKTCPICGTDVPTGAGGSTPPPAPAAPPAPHASNPATPVPLPSPAPPTQGASDPSDKTCVLCGARVKRGEPDWADGFHTPDGGELRGDAGAGATPPSASAGGAQAAPASAGAPSAPSSPPPPIPSPSPPPQPAAPPQPPTPARPVRPPAGTTCIVVYNDKKDVVRYYPIVRDITKIGRCDAVAGEFPEIDLAALFSEDVARKVSRKHALVIRSRETGKIALRPLAKNTGTQVEQEICADKTDYALSDGSRILLGRTIRMKLEVIK